MINGRGEVLSFGGQVMKNVAGYDVSRLLVGSLGVLGVICEVSLKVLPVAPAETSLCFVLDESTALARMHAWARQPLPVNAGAWYDGVLYLRLRGAQAAVHAACRQIGGERLASEQAGAWRDSVRDHGHAFFRLAASDLQRGESLWRLSLPPTCTPLALHGK